MKVIAGRALKPLHDINFPVSRPLMAVDPPCRPVRNLVRHSGSGQTDPGLEVAIGEFHLAMALHHDGAITVGSAVDCDGTAFNAKTKPPVTHPHPRRIISRKLMRNVDGRS